ncbi:hypothetical protein [Streptomyces sp. WM6378]|uniref:hypothetical protein n=1 Tax=Streptomyces sp. WM6378 TaxID=1415557 RepID=UPI00131CCDE4|nr:hypothetical protein [Streptomyces sp. WM6378]
MRRTVLPIAVILLAAACSGGPSKPTGTVHDPGGPAPTSSATVPAGSAHGGGKLKPSASAGHCPPTRDIIVWTKAPGVPDLAQELGNFNALTCESTFKWLQHTSPTGDGYCTEAAWASDNQGYNTDAEPAKRLKKVQVAIGPAC